MGKYKPPNECVTSESIKADKKLKRIKFYAKFIIAIPLVMRLIQQLKG